MSTEPEFLVAKDGMLAALAITLVTISSPLTIYLLSYQISWTDNNFKGRSENVTVPLKRLEICCKDFS